MAVSLLFQVVHLNANDIGTDWLVVISCLAQLADFSPGSSDEALNIASNLSRVGLFSASLKDDSLKLLTSSLIEHSNTKKTSRSVDVNSITFGNELYLSTRKKLQDTKLITKADDFRDLPVDLVLLVDVAIENSQRFLCFGQEVMVHFSVQASTSTSGAIRTFSLDVLSYLITSGIAVIGGEDKQNGYSGEKLNANELLAPLCDCISNTKFVDAAELGLAKLKQIVDDGYHLAAAWPTIINALSTVADGPRNNGDWGVCCTIAFGCLKLIVDGKNVRALGLPSVITLILTLRSYPYRFLE